MKIVCSKMVLRLLTPEQKEIRMNICAGAYFRPRQTRQLPRSVDLKGRLLSCQSY